MNTARILAFSLAAAAAGCGIPLSEPESTPINECSTSDDCAGGGVCAPVASGNACVADRADLPGLMLEIRPTATSAIGASVTYFVNVAEQGLTLQDVVASGQVRRFDPQLPALARVDGALRLPTGAPRCDMMAPADGSFPARAVLRRVARLPGLPSEEYTATAQPDVDEQGAILGYSFHADLPRGVYDIYVAPELPEGCATGPLPIFWPAQEISSAANTLNIEASEPQRLWGKLLVPPTMSIDGWSLELVEPEHGDLISESFQLMQASGVVEVDFDLDFDWTAQSRFAPLIRLRPPEGEALPTLHWDLSAVGILIGQQGLELSLTELDALPRHVEGTVLDTAGQPVVATVQIQSAEIAGDASSTAKYRLEVETDASGVFAADLPPGRYRVVARPVDLTRAATSKEIEFTAGDGCFCGQSIVVPNMSVLGGSVIGPGGEQMGGASVVAVPSALSSPRYFDQVLTLSPLQPREASAPLYGSGFALEVDPGSFDFSVRPLDGSGFPWLVRSRLFVAGADIAASVDLGELTVPYPAVLQGVIRDAAGEALPGAVVRAWLPVGDPAVEGEPMGVLQIGETLADGDGSYSLPLPPSL